MLDTVRPGEDDGELGPARLGWIAGELAAHPALPTLLAMHHPPFACGIRGMDRLALAAADRDALAALLREHPQVCGVVAGHVHRTMATALAGRPATAIPGTYGQFPLQFDDPGLRVVAEPLAFAVHALVDGRLVSHVQTLPRTA
jgi:3',5'-cyclic AMP phosphodiesterase CpdA